MQVYVKYKWVNKNLSILHGYVYDGYVCINFNANIKPNHQIVDLKKTKFFSVMKITFHFFSLLRFNVFIIFYAIPIYLITMVIFLTIPKIDLSFVNKVFLIDAD